MDAKCQSLGKIRKEKAAAAPLVKDILRDVLDVFVSIYLDDILIFSTDLNSHEGHVRWVLQWLLDHHLYVKAEKCVFHSSSTSFLGNIIDEGTVSMDPEKVCAVHEWPVHETQNQLQQFLGFANFYQRFTKNFSSITAPSSRPDFFTDMIFLEQRSQGGLQDFKGKVHHCSPVPKQSLQYIVEVDALEVIRRKASEFPA